MAGGRAFVPGSRRFLSSIGLLRQPGLRVLLVLCYNTIMSRNYLLSSISTFTHA